MCDKATATQLLKIAIHWNPCGSQAHLHAQVFLAMKSQLFARERPVVRWDKFQYFHSFLRMPPLTMKDFRNYFQFFPINKIKHLFLDLLYSGRSCMLNCFPWRLLAKRFANIGSVFLVAAIFLTNRDCVAFVCDNQIRAVALQQGSPMWNAEVVQRNTKSTLTGEM